MNATITTKKENTLPMSLGVGLDENLAQTPMRAKIIFLGFEVH